MIMVPYSFGKFSYTVSVKLKGHSSDLVLQLHKVRRLLQEILENNKCSKGYDILSFSP